MMSRNYVFLERQFTVDRMHGFWRCVYERRIPSLALRTNIMALFSWGNILVSCTVVISFVFVN